MGPRYNGLQRDAEQLVSHSYRQAAGADLDRVVGVLVLLGDRLCEGRGPHGGAVGPSAGRVPGEENQVLRSGFLRQREARAVRVATVFHR